MAPVERKKQLNIIMNLNFKTIFPATLVILTSCYPKSIKEPEQIGKQVFETLKNINDKSNKRRMG
jgi:hypothetical protein